MAVSNPRNLYESQAADEKELRSGALALLDEKGRVFKILVGEDAEYYWEAKYDAGLVYCSICDGIGHGQPGYGPCPLEDRGYDISPEEEARERYFEGLAEQRKADKQAWADFDAQVQGNYGQEVAW